MKANVLGLCVLLACGGAPKPVEPALPATPNVSAEPIAGTAASASATASATAAPKPGASAAQAKHDDGRIEKALREVEGTRGLKATRAVPGVVLPRAEMLAKVRAHVDKEVPEAAIEREGLVLKLLGLVPISTDYKATMFSLLEEELAGFYEPADGTMYLAQDLPDELAKMTLYHELVHALQDHTWNLKAHSTYKPGESDRAFTRSALAEGDATSAMLDPLLAARGVKSYQVPPDMLEQLMSQATEKPNSKIPKVLRRSLIAPYIMGLRFVSALRKENDWKSVDAAWANPPVTSEQILHVEKWKGHEAALATKAPTFATLPGYTMTDEDTTGEAGLKVLYEALDLSDAARLAAHWGGDRSIFVENATSVAMAMRLQFDRGSSADYRGQGKDRLLALSKGFTKLFKAPAMSSDTFVCFERPDLGPLAIAQKGDELFLAAGPAKRGTSNSFSADATCAQAKKWAEENGL
jgi:hypothetical protein